MKSKFLKLDARDFLKGAFLAIVTAIVTGFYELLTAGGDLTWLTIKPILLTAAAAFLSYIIKNFLTNSEGKILMKENRRGKGGGTFKVISLFLFMLLPAMMSAQHLVPRSAAEENKQNPWKGFFRPVSNNIFATKAIESVTPSLWLFRPTVEVSAMQLIFSDTPGKVFDVSSFRNVGMGISYSHFISVNDLPYNNYGFSFIALFDAIPRETTSFNISPVVTVNALEFLNFGAGYSIGTNEFFLLVGLSYNFN